ncbi:unnamed protein product [Microthlaspi erraticum]|uniref:Integrase catalytic domain-containing protein n=1 Tax=Microthlaspi erraticum TaxID=1685480 RepID=A0A6D2JC28_9BRAS|nr:unnamed protein product [Microthlaspi erraticum]
MLIGAGEERGGEYVFRGVMGAKANKTTISGSCDLWHRRLGHPSSRVLSYLSSDLEFEKHVDSKPVCEICLRAKQTRDCFHESSNKAIGVFDLIHCDVWGAYRTLSTSGSAYFLTIVDDCSRAVWVYLLQEKREVAENLKNFFKMVERQFNKKVRVVRSDNGGEFMCMKPYFAEEGILHQTSCVYTPQQNGCVERKHRHILNVSRSLMFQASLPIRFWGECVLTACHLINRTPSTLLNGKTPFEILHGVAPSYTTLKVFGSLCHARNILRDKDKFGERSRRCVFMGYPFGQKGWRVWDIEKQEFFCVKGCVFEETVFPFASVIKQNDDMPRQQQQVSIHDDDFIELGKELVVPHLDERGSGPIEEIVVQSDEEDHDDHRPDEQGMPEQEIVPVRRSGRERTTSTRLDGFVLYTTQCSNDPLSSLFKLASTSVFD